MRRRLGIIGWLMWCCWSAASLAGTPVEDGLASGKGLMDGRFSSRDALKQNAIQPIQGQKDFVDQNGNAFAAAIQCGSAVPMLEVLGSPGSTGDLTTVIISADMDLNGSFDVSVSPAVHVSGVCANGFISCDAGTWDNCEGWAWEATPSSVSAVPTEIRLLKGCYCNNNSCGSSIPFTHIDILLKDLGTGVAQAIQKVKPDYVITDVISSPANVKFYGASSAGCRSGTTGQEAYLGNPTAINTDLPTQVAAQEADPDSLYSTIIGSPAATASAVTDNNCVIDRQIPVSDADCSISPDQIHDSCGTLEANPDCTLKSEMVDGVETYKNFMPTGLVPLPSTRTVTSPSGTALQLTDHDYELSSISYGYAETLTGFQTVTDIDLAVREDGTRMQYSRTPCVKEHQVCQWSESQPTRTDWNGDVYPDYSWSKTGNTRTTTKWNPSWGIYRTVTEYEYCKTEGNFGFIDDTNIIWVDGGCRGNFTVTGWELLPCGYDLTRDWWTKERVYQCSAQPSTFNFDDALHRTGVAHDTAKTDVGFTETHKDDSGQWVSQEIALGSPPELPTVESCEPVCKLKQETLDDRANPVDTTATNRTTSVKVSYRYAVCTDGGLCPSKPGETIVKNCQCVNDFAEAATIMQLLRQAGQDLLCQPATTSN